MLEEFKAAQEEEEEEEEQSDGDTDKDGNLQEHGNEHTTRAPATPTRSRLHAHGKELHPPASPGGIRLPSASHGVATDAVEARRASVDVVRQVGAGPPCVC